MAVIQTIRNKLGPIIVIVIGLSLALFILETALNSNTRLMSGNKDVVGVIDGDKIHYRDFQNRVDESVNNYKLQTQQKNVDDNTMFSIRDQTWNQLVSEKINGDQYSKLGLVVGSEELKDMFFGKDPVPEIRQAFTNPNTGIFDPLAVKNYYENLDQTGQNEQPGERRMRWVAFEKAQIDQRLSNKYSDLIKNAMYVPKWMAEVDYSEKNTRASVNFVMVPYTTISDSAVKVTDAELQQYLDTHKEQFKQNEEFRQLDYVIFKVQPSAADTADVVKTINDVYQKLAAAPDDTNVLKLNSDKGLDKYYYKKDGIESAYVRDTLMKVPVGSLVGPYFESGAYRIVKLMDRREVPDSVKAHHILIAVQQGGDSTVAKNRIDSIYNAVKSGTSFDSLAARFSDDKGSGVKGGDLGFAPQGIYVKNFNNYLFFDGKPGDMKIVRTEFGYHLIRIDEVKNVSTAVQINFVTRPLEASSETDKQIFEKASKFAVENNTADLFKKTAEDQKLNKMTAPNVQKNAFALPGLQSAREVVKWAFQAKPGEVSSPFALPDNYVVAVLTGIKPEGTATIDDVRPQLELQVRKQKKGEQIASQLSAAASLNATLEGIATKVNQPVKTSSSVSFANAYSENIGYEPKVVGTVFSLKENQLSKPVIGEQGVFVVQVQSFTKPEPIADYSQFRQQLLNSLQPRVQYGIAEALKKSVKIEDTRYLFF